MLDLARQKLFLVKMVGYGYTTLQPVNLNLKKLNPNFDDFSCKNEFIKNLSRLF